MIFPPSSPIPSASPSKANSSNQTVFKLEQREIREEGLAISGEIANEIFLLPEGDPITMPALM